MQEANRIGCVRVERGRRTPYGHWTVLDESGRTVQEVDYDDRGQPREILLRYSETGQERERQSFDAGVPSGLWTLWYGNGQLKEERSYSRGKLHGLRRLWAEDGKPNGMRCFVAGRAGKIEDCYLIMSRSPASL